MKTTLINTEFWKDNAVFKLNIDTKIVYLYLLTSPEKGLGDIFYFNPNLISFFCGINLELVDKCMKQLQDLGFISIKDDYYKLLKGHQMPKKGRFTERVLNDELKKLPEDIINYFGGIELLTDEEDNNSSGVAPEHIYKDNNKDINNSNNKVIKLIDKKAFVLADLLASKVVENFPFVKTDPNKWAKDIEMINRIDKYTYEQIEFILLWSQNDSFWKKNIRSGDKLRKQFTSLMVQAKCDSDKNQRKVVRV